MAIEKNSFKVVSSTRLESEFSSRSREESMSSEDDDFQRRGALDLDEDEDDYDDCDSGAGSDDFDLLELGETGEEFCQIGDQTCSIPFELYDLQGLNDILSMNVWNDVLTEDERVSLTKYLPDMDQEHFMRTMKELFTGSNFHFGVPITKLFDMLKGGLCEPRVSLYRQGLGFFQKHKHYHVIRKHQNTMVNNLVSIRDAWTKCRGYSIEEKLRVLNIMKSQKSLMYEKMEELETDSSEFEESRLSSKQKRGNNYPGFRFSPTLALEPPNKQNPKGTLKVSGSKTGTGSGPSGSNRGYEERTMYDVAVHQNHNFSRNNEKKFKGLHVEEFPETFMGLPVSLRTDMNTFGRNRTVNSLSDIKVLTSRPSNVRVPYDYGKRLKRPESNNMYPGGEQIWHNQEPIEVPYRMGQKKGRMVNNGGRVVAAAEGMKMLAKGEETESDSSEQFGEEDDDNNPLMRSKWAYPSGIKPGSKGKKNNKNSRKNGDFRDVMIPGSEDMYTLKGKQKGKFNNNNNNNNNHFDDFNGHVEVSEMFQVPLRKPKRKDYSTLVNMNNYFDDPSVVRSKKGQIFEGYANERLEMGDVRLIGCNSVNPVNSVSRKRKIKDESMYIDEQENLGYSNSSPQQQPIDDVSYVKRRKWTDTIPFENMMMNDAVIDTTEEDLEVENKSQKKPFTLITPTVHTGFSFSIIHLLSAVRMAMVSLLPEDSMDVGKNPNQNNEEVQEAVNGEQGTTTTNSDPLINPNLPSLTVKDIVNRVRSNPGDPCILETQEPLQDLVRGVLKIFSSKTAPLGAKGWKSLVLYKKSIKSWSWVGPVSQNSSDNETVEEVTSPESWGLPHKMLVKLVDSFANWLKSGQETLQQIGSLPAPPLTLMQLNLDEKERFRDLRAQKSLNTINPSSEEVRGYFRKEEVLRYLIPDRAFAYTAVDGKKSTVAPSRKGAGKPTSKARDHFMLKRDRPPHVTILCLVRDAAARLPGSIGTRADVCTLIRDSQYIVEDVSDAQVNQVVSGALDRLHYERDPCVQFDGERKLWVYLHREREEEDFEDDGTSSTKKWKRQKKESGEGADQGGGVTLAYRGPGEQTGFDLSSDLNVDPASGGGDDKIVFEKNSNNNDDFDDGRDEDTEFLNTSVS